MKDLDFYSNAYNVKDEESVFDRFLKNLKPSNMLWSYFVNWDKVLRNVEEIEIELNILNYLIGKKELEDAFRKLVKKNPSIVKVLPALAVRAGNGLTKFEIVTDYEKGSLMFKEYNFNDYNPEHINRYIEFLDGTGIKDLLQSKRVKNLVDYMIGVEAGLNSNARKNRAGTAMEEIVEIFIKDFCNQRGYVYIKEANATAIKKAFNHDVLVDRQNRRYDFVVNDGKNLIVFEVNFYNSKGGSKLKATAGEYTGLYDILKGENIRFVWITDGPGWLSVKAGLREAFHKMDYIFNLYALERGVLLKEF